VVGGHDFALFCFCDFISAAGRLGRVYVPWPRAAECNLDDKQTN